MGSINTPFFRAESAGRPGAAIAASTIRVVAAVILFAGVTKFWGGASGSAAALAASGGRPGENQVVNGPWSDEKSTQKDAEDDAKAKAIAAARAVVDSAAGKFDLGMEFAGSLHPWPWTEESDSNGGYVNSWVLVHP